MRVRIVRGFANADRGFAPGSVVEMDDIWAKALVGRGLVIQDDALDGPPEAEGDEPETEGDEIEADKPKGKKAKGE